MDESPLPWRMSTAVRQPAVVDHPVRVWRYTCAGEAQAACDVAAGEAVFAGGATALQLAWAGAPPPQVLIPVQCISGARGIELHADALHLGAAEPLEHLRTDERVRRHAPMLEAACAAVGSLALRHLATLGGNIGWRHGDVLTALLALDAQVRGSEPHWRPLAELIRQPVLPLIVAVRVPRSAGGDRWRFEKTGFRAAFMPSRLTLALRGDGLSDRRWRVAAGSAAMTARRLVAVEGLLASGDVESPAPGVPPASQRQQRLLQACREDLPGQPALAALASRLLGHHLSVLR